jgi:hypothetical protein
MLKRDSDKDKTPDGTEKKWTMFSTPKKEVEELLVDLGQATIGQDTITFTNYPFEPSIAFRQNIFKPSDIDNIDTTSFPPTIKIGNELIFVSAKQNNELIKFVKDNNIKTVDRPNLWDWILEPFLDTEFTDEMNQRINKLLAEYGLTVKIVISLRQEVETQMLKYNFDTMLWDWTNLGASDVLRAMRTKYDKEKFREFYNRVMNIALTNKIAV